MKTILLGLLLLGFAGSTFAIDRAELDRRIMSLTAKFDALQQQPGKAIPADVLSQAKGVVLLDRTKAGFLFAYQGGGGVALVKNPETQNWSPPAFLGASEASLGFQVGGEQNFYVILLMNTNALELLTQSNIEFGGEARGTAGTTSSGVGENVTTGEKPMVLVYDDRKGLYGGAAIKGGAIRSDDEANRVYYETYATMQDVLFNHRVQATQAGYDLATKINYYADVNSTTGSTK